MFNMTELEELLLEAENIDMSRLHESVDIDKSIDKEIRNVAKKVGKSSLSLDEKLEVLKELSHKKTIIGKSLTVEEMFEELERNGELWNW